MQDWSLIFVLPFVCRSSFSYSLKNADIECLNLSRIEPSMRSTLATTGRGFLFALSQTGSGPLPHTSPRVGMTTTTTIPQRESDPSGQVCF